MCSPSWPVGETSTESPGTFFQGESSVGCDSVAMTEATVATTAIAVSTTSERGTFMGHILAGGGRGGHPSTGRHRYPSGMTAARIAVADMARRSDDPRPVPPLPSPSTHCDKE